jgi:hypothetical protein
MVSEYMNMDDVVAMFVFAGRPATEKRRLRSFVAKVEEEDFNAKGASPRGCKLSLDKIWVGASLPSLQQLALV